MFKATNEIYEAITKAGIKASIRERDKISEVCLIFPLEYSAPFEIRFISRDDDNDVSVRVDLMRVKPEDVDVVLPLINDLNVKDRHVKFTLDSDNDINVEYDMPLSGNQVGACATEMIIRFGKVVHEAHPLLLDALVRGRKEDEVC